jgi:hypothetical protein
MPPQSGDRKAAFGDAWHRLPVNAAMVEFG